MCELHSCRGFSPGDPPCISHSMVTGGVITSLSTVYKNVVVVFRNPSSSHSDHSRSSHEDMNFGRRIKVKHLNNIVYGHPISEP